MRAKRNRFFSTLSLSQKGSRRHASNGVWSPEEDGPRATSDPEHSYGSSITSEFDLGGSGDVFRGVLMYLHDGDQYVYGGSGEHEGA